MLDFFTGFDFYSDNEAAAIGLTPLVNGTAIGTAQTRTGSGNSCLVQSNSGFAKYGLSNAQTRVLGFAIRPTAFSNNGNTYGVFCGLLDGATAQISFALTNTGAIAIFRGLNIPTITSSTTGLLGTSTNLLSLNTWYYVELVVKTDPTVGTVEVYVNGTKTGWIDLTGQNTRNTANSYTNGLQFLGTTGISDYIDDLYCLSTTGGANTTRLGDVRALAKNVSTGNGTNAGSTPSTGTDRGAMVLESPPNGDTNYNAFTAVGQIDTYRFPALGVSGTIYGLQVHNFTRKTDAAPCSALAQAYIGGVLYNGTAGALGMSYAYSWTPNMWENSPATSTAWTASEINGAEFGIKRSV